MNFLARKLARVLVGNSDRTFDEDFVRYGAEVSLGVLLQLGIFLLAGYFCGLFKEILGILIACAIMRRYSGGAHCSTYYGCTISGLLHFLFLAYILTLVDFSDYYKYFIFAAIICCGLVFWLAPVDNPVKRISDATQKKHLKYKSLLVLAALLILSLVLHQFNRDVFAGALLIGLLWQSLTLTPGGEIYITAWDRFLLGIVQLIERRKHDVKST